MRWTSEQQQHVSLFFSLIKKQSLNSKILFKWDIHTHTCIYPNEYDGKSIDLKSWNPCEEGHTSWEKEAKKNPRWIIFCYCCTRWTFFFIIEMPPPNMYTEEKKKKKKDCHHFVVVFTCKDEVISIHWTMKIYLSKICQYERKCWNWIRREIV
jgi:hypothetical protein